MHIKKAVYSTTIVDAIGALGFLSHKRIYPKDHKAVNVGKG